MFKFIKKSLIAVIIGISLFNSVALAYDDVPADSPYFYGIEYLRRNDVFASTKLFKPDIIISRAEFIKYLVVLNSPKFKHPKTVKLPFADTKNNAWYAPYFDEAIKLGILDSNEKNVYPDRKITVVEAIEFIFHSKSIPIPRKYVGPIPYKDVEANKDLQALIMRASELGVAQPEKADFFGMYTRVTRAKAAYMIYKMDLVDLRDPNNAATTDQSSDPLLQKIITSWDLINSNYVDRDTIDKQALSDNAIKGMVDTLKDPYSVYMDAQANQAFADDLGGEFEGIGAYIEIDKQNNFTIVAPIKDSPAEKAGVQSGDIIKKVDDFSVDGATLYDVVGHIKGPKGTTVKLTLLRDGATVIINIVRDSITVKPIEYDVTPNGKYMHIKIASFNQNAVSDFKDVVDIILNNKDIKGVIIDLRDDPGGLLDAAVGILNFLLPKDSVAVQIAYNYFSLSQTTSGEGELKDYPMVVLVNKGSASASEIVAGALKDLGVAKVIGETSFGKGTVQEINYFPDNSSIKLTIAKWLTPLGKSINHEGIKPDIEVIKGTGQANDVQLERAITELDKMVR